MHNAMSAASPHGPSDCTSHCTSHHNQQSTARRNHHGTQRGITAVELMIVMSIAAILAAAAIPSFAPTLQRYRATTAANDLQRAFALARAQSLAVGDRVVVAPMSNGDWRTGWRVFIDANSNGSFEAGDTALQVFEALPAGMGTQSSANFALDGGQFVSFNAFGQPRALNGTSFADGNVLLTFGDVSRRVCVDARGRAAVVSSTCP